MSSDQKPLHDLRVIDLRNELEKRGQDKSGVKAVLIDRLSEALIAEGKDPSSLMFDVTAGHERKSAGRKTAASSACDSETDDSCIDGPEVDNVDSAPVKADAEATAVVKSSDDVVQAIATKDGLDTSVDVERKMDKKVETMDLSEQERNASVSAVTSPVSAAEALKSSGEVVSAAAMNKDSSVPAPAASSSHGDTELASSSEIKAAPSSDSGKSSGKSDLKPEEGADVSEGSAQAITSSSCSTDGASVDTVTNSGVPADDKKISSLPADGQTAPAVVTSVASSDSSDATTTGGSRPEQSCEGGKDKDQSVSSTTESSASQVASSEQSKPTVQQTVDSSTDKDAKKTDKPVSTSVRNLWVSGLSSTTRATDLKQAFSKYGKVAGAKVVTNAKQPGGVCYGYITMSTPEDASLCIQHLHRTELHGRMISVEKAKGDSTVPPRTENKPRVSTSTSAAKDDKRRSASDRGKQELKDSPTKSSDKTSNSKPAEKNDAKPSEPDTAVAAGCSVANHTGEGGATTAAADKSTTVAKEGVKTDAKDKSAAKVDQKSRIERTEKAKPDKKVDSLSFEHIKEEREKQRQRQREREERERERRRKIEEDVKRREIEREQRIEARRLERERDKLRQEREAIEREKAELLRMERERLEREKEELRRQHQKLEEVRRAVKRPREEKSDVLRRHHETRRSDDSRSHHYSPRDEAVAKRSKIEPSPSSRLHSSSRIAKKDDRREDRGRYSPEPRPKEKYPSSSGRGERNETSWRSVTTLKSQSHADLNHHSKVQLTAKSSLPSTPTPWASSKTGGSGSTWNSHGSSQQQSRWITASPIPSRTSALGGMVGGPAASLYGQSLGAGGVGMPMASNQFTPPTARFDAYKHNIGVRRF